VPGDDDLERLVVGHPRLNHRRRHPYLVRVAIAIDQLANAVAGGHQDETISSRLGKRKLQRGGILRWNDWWGVAKPLDWLLERLDPGHSLNAIEPDEGDPPQPPRP